MDGLVSISDILPGVLARLALAADRDDSVGGLQPEAVRTGQAADGARQKGDEASDGNAGRERHQSTPSR